MKKVSKWPSRAFNLLMVLAMVISLSAILVASPAAAAETPPPCSPMQTYPNCNLDVAVNTYIKNADMSFTPQSSFNPPMGSATGQCFYVNAVVVNNGNNTAYAPINATIDLPSGISLDANQEETDVLSSGNGYTQTWAEGNLSAGREADFWWLVCCTEANGNSTIGVNVTSSSSGGPSCEGEGSTWVYQGTPTSEKCLEIEIVEAPGLGTVTGQLATYSSALPSTIQLGQCFGIKAEVTNFCDTSVPVGDVYIGQDFEEAFPNSLFSINNGDPDYWDVGTLAPGQTAVVAWTLCCEGPGSGNITVWSEDQYGITNFVNDPVTVHQATPGGLIVQILQPTGSEDCAGNLTIKEPTNNCTGSGKFDVKALVTNTGGATVTQVEAIAVASGGSSWVLLSKNDIDLANLAPGASEIADFGNATCRAVGPGNISVSAEGTSGGLPVQSQSDWNDTSWWVQISQQQIIAAYSPATDVAPLPDEVNVCQQFDVIFRYYNYTGPNNDWVTSPSVGNVTACLNIDPWDLDSGQVTLLSATRRKITSGVPAENWQNATFVSGNCVSIPAICGCCAEDVDWHVQCTTNGTVSFNSIILVNDPVPNGLAQAFVGNDTSETVCVDQVWKADLTGDVIFFVQDANGIMTEQGAVTPGTYFHVVMPVINTGEATAQNVQVYFDIAGLEPGTYSFVSLTGDALSNSTFNPTTGVGIANLGDIPGGQTKKAILYLQCLQEGAVGVEIPASVSCAGCAFNNLKGISGIDANTGTWIPQDNIFVPNCIVYIDQIPFKVQLENPQTCQTFTQGDYFAVKALVTNGSLTTNLTDVDATLVVTDSTGATIDLSNGNVTLVAYGTQTAEKLVGNISANSSSEITWELQCNGGGEAFIQVLASLTNPNLTAPSDVVNVHQIPTPEPKLQVEILSPQDVVSQHSGKGGGGGPFVQTGNKPFADTDGTYVGTGEQFALTAMVWNYGTGDASNVTATIGTQDAGRYSQCAYRWIDEGDGTNTTYDIYCDCITPGSLTVYMYDENWNAVDPGNYSVAYNLMDKFGPYTEITFSTAPPDDTCIFAQYLAGFSLLAGDQVASLGDIPAGGYAMYTWTLAADTTCASQCTVLPSNLMVQATADNLVNSGNPCWKPWKCDDISVFVYPAAHLVAQITGVIPSSTILAGSGFTVDYTVTNVGQSDAWNSSVTLGVNPAASVGIALGPNGYTQSLGTVPGLASSPNNVYSGSFTLQCEQATLSTLTITPMGYDECGYGPTTVQNCQYDEHGNKETQTCQNEIDWEGNPGAPIQGKFLEADYYTVNQINSGQLDLAVTKTVDNAFPAKNQTVNFTITVTNNGPTAATGVKVTDSLPGALTFVSATPSQGSWTAPTWTVGGLVVGGSATLVIAATVTQTTPITNTATVTCDQPDPFQSNNSASVTLNMTSMSITLNKGWNLISLPLMPTNGNITALFSGLPVDAIWSYNGGTWHYYGDGVLTALADGLGYWVHMTAAATLTESGIVNPLPPQTPPTYPVAMGWNMIGFKSTYARTASAYLGSVPWVRIWGYSNGWVPMQGSDTMQPGLGYWIAATSAGTIYP